jgi:DNA-directed RNA polymerase specialized sigma24 family protein
LLVVLSWADRFRRRTGKWPSAVAGRVEGAPGLTWSAVDKALRYGYHGMPGGDSLARLLQRERGLPVRRAGRPPKPARRQAAARLRADGLTLAEIGRRLGISRQAAHQMLRHGTAASRRPAQAS